MEQQTITQPILETNRLILRPFELTDAKRVQELAGDERIASTTLNIPHPYKDGMAEAWINTHDKNLQEKIAITYAITLKEGNVLVGAIGLMLKVFNKAEMAYWVGVPYWGKGYCSEAGKALMKFGFDELELNKIYALCMKGNRGSSKVMEKMGMIFEGLKREDVMKWGEYVDLESYSILRKEYEGK
ncbi:GNAT family N-acetyltransferase [Alkaliphilus hydrothermalis]|uniref:RimJ/RimL family protein N-acetyltransferase n=1 Tax=Alkaliphilus hydrothermalis TaxID=1482730 RepID=A0ABS2NM40_9FIRM|nr:GNAT family N-acetyltransferase [Alkaliphilus hydrothermalis]MBM7613644.1 RimJ/RimL family protein N-acetyltransferase [Alkaliphilus hydrothermalis]